MTSLAAPLPHNAHSVPKLSPHHHAPITTQSHNSSMVTLPRLRIPTDSEIMSAQQQQWPVAAAAAQYQQQQPQQVQVPQQQQHAAMPMKAAAGPLTRSPSSPAAFFEDPDNKFGLTHLLEAAEQCLPVPVRPINNNNMFQHQEQTLPASLRKRSFSEREPVQQQQPQPQPQFYTQQQPQQQQPPYQFQQQLPSMAQHKMPSLGYLVSEEDRSYKRARPELSFNSFPASQSPSMSGFQHFQHQQSLSQSQSHYQQQQSPSYNTQAPAQMYRSPVLSGMHGMVSPIGSSGSCSPSTGVPMPSMIWETVIASGKFPSDVCLSENGQSSANKSGDAGSGSSSTASSDNPVKQGRWTCDEKEFAEALIQSVRNGDAVLPPNVSLRKFIADSLQCKAMRVSKKFRSLRACQSPTQGGGEGISPTDLDDASHSHKSFNPLSLSSIMNNEAAVEYESAMQQQHMSTPVSAASSHESQSNSNMGGLGKKPQRVLKRSDYSQHGVVRSGRWSLEEENYAKAMIEAFKNGYLPLHGNVSLRKFLSEVLVCHPMRISKKFVGYVRKYHWYRIAAGKCDPEAKQKALEELSQLERAFWASMQQSNDWALAAQDE